MKINLNDLKLKTFTEQNASDYCLFNINSSDITELNLYYNELTDMSGIRLFKNLKELDLSFNKLTDDISVLKNLKNLESLDLNNNKITVIRYLKKNLNI